MVWSHLYDEYVNTSIDVNACICRKCLEGYTHTQTHTLIVNGIGESHFFFNLRTFSSAYMCTLLITSVGKEWNVERDNYQKMQKRRKSENMATKTANIFKYLF